MTSNKGYALALASAALLCGTAAQAQESSHSQPQRELRTGDVQASDLIGANVKRMNGDSIGDITDLIVSADREVRLAVITVGGLLGVGEKTVAVPFDQLSVAPDGSTVYLRMSEDELANLPKFDIDGDAENADRTRAAAEPAASRGADAIVETSAHDSAERTRATRSSEQFAADLIGTTVLDSQNANVGKVRDLIVSGAVTQAVLAMGGGIAGLGAHLVVVPLAELKVNRGINAAEGDKPESLQTLLTASELGALPEFRYE